MPIFDAHMFPDPYQSSLQCCNEQTIYPDLVIKGENYIPNPNVLTIASIIDLISWTIILLMLFGDYIFNALGIAPPNLYLQAKENSMLVIVMTFFLSNTIKQNLLSTGAFEIALDGDLLFSKLETGRMPAWPELMRTLDVKLRT
ncbi:hypothetical protein PTSG_03057 [Salpingoeca rosetta]|uniref:Selenoprotein T n=1 Tax=Salpingoeca rosetta (strain ATCC 50818 / BSB-021) TaxID=946362 RepID=F2U448_SALR5|nr:uncharacterized protein PTSG_03057 [Salpingoeca rosetta]EGD82414.1 hypothetical protein PTSG_03057 [Salpingoeca rosetta]|eukprot:XP_004995650.1 hypothetical protein PTSG_03057 [Salpingoeca rosetta]